jgi:hypothetical protein
MFKVGQKVIAKRFAGRSYLNGETALIEKISETGGLFVRWKKLSLNNEIGDISWQPKCFDVLDNNIKCRVK